MKVFFDIETVKTRREDYIDRVRKTIKPPATHKKEETKQKWMDENFVEAVNEEVERTVFNGGLCHSVQIQWAIDDGETTVALAESIEQEKDVIRQFFDAVTAKPTQSSLTFIGHNIAAFDLRILRQRAIVLGIDAPSNLRRAFAARPWDDILFDTMLQWDSQNKVSMDNLCYYLDVPTPKSDITGANYGQYWSNKLFDDCRRYGMAEIPAIQEVYERMR